MRVKPEKREQRALTKKPPGVSREISTRETLAELSLRLATPFCSIQENPAAYEALAGKGRTLMHEASGGLGGVTRQRRWDSATAARPSNRLLPGFKSRGRQMRDARSQTVQKPGQVLKSGPSLEEMRN